MTLRDDLAAILHTCTVACISYLPGRPRCQRAVEASVDADALMPRIEQAIRDAIRAQWIDHCLAIEAAQTERNQAVDDAGQRAERHLLREVSRWIDMADSQEDAMASDEDLAVHDGRADAAASMRESLADYEAGRVP